jgi:hypothetical protein
MTKAKALQNAQKMLISKRQYWHPIYWAPFLLNLVQKLYLILGYDSLYI